MVTPRPRARGHSFLDVSQPHCQWDALMGSEVIKYIIGLGELLISRLLIYDGLSSRFSEARVKKDPKCEECGPHQPPHLGAKG